MLISLDYDSTYTLDPGFWNQFIYRAHKVGHQVICVTLRTPTEAERINIGIPIYCTSREAKLVYMMNQGISPDVWIDDCPVNIVEDHPKRDYILTKGGNHVS